MQELFFQNQPIMWLTPWINSVWISLSSFVIIVYIILRKKYRRISTQKHIPEAYNEISINDTEYVSRTLFSLKEYLWERISPNNITAHTADEISTYLDNPALIVIIQELERIEYSGIILNPSECTNYNNRIRQTLSEYLLK